MRTKLETQLLIAVVAMLWTVVLIGVSHVALQCYDRWEASQGCTPDLELGGDPVAGTGFWAPTIDPEAS